MYILSSTIFLSILLVEGHFTDPPSKSERKSRGMKRRKKKKEIILIRKRYESRRNCFRSIFAGEQLRGMTHTRRIERIIVLRKGEGNSEGIVPWSFAYFTMPRTSICRKFRWPFQKLNSWERRLEGVEICQLFDVKFTRSCVFISIPPPPQGGAY